MEAASPPPLENRTGEGSSAKKVEDILRGAFIEVPRDRYRCSALMECRKAEEAVQAGNYRKALRLIEVDPSLPGASHHLARFHRVRGKIYAAIAKAVADPDEKWPYYAAAANSAFIAAELRPFSVEYSYFYGKSLYDVAKEPDDYAKVIEECKRGLDVIYPVDTLDDVMDKSTFVSAGSFIESCRRHLKKLIWNSHLAIISDPKGPIGKADDAIQMEEEQHKGARLDMVHLISSSSVSEAKELGERMEMEEVVRNFWNSLSDLEREKLLRVEVLDVVNHFGPMGTPWLRFHLMLAIFWARTHDESWDYFPCPSPSESRPVCNSFWDPEPLRQHTLQEHVPDFGKLKKPDRIDDEMAKLISKSSWKPVDREATWKVLNDLERIPAETSPSPYCWIISNDSKRRQSLKKIHCAFSRLITQGCLAVGHVDQVLKFALNGLHWSQDDTLSDFPVCIWCLGETQLLEILKFLQHIDPSCRADNTAEHIDSYSDDIKNMLKRLEMKDQIVLDDGGVYFSIQEGLLLDLPSKQGWKDWYKRFEEKLQEGLKVIEMLQEECHGLQLLCNRRIKLLHDETALASQIPNPSEISTIDALILQKDAQIERLSHKFTATMAVDYQTLLIPLVFSFVQAKLKYCAIKYAVKESASALDVDIMDMSNDDGLLTVKVSNFKAYFGSLMVDFVDEFISQCLEHAGTNETWSLFVCCKCKHLDNHQNKWPGLPNIVSGASAEMFLSQLLEPLDGQAQPSVHTLPSMCLTEELEQLLKKIQDRFVELIRHGYLAESHLNMVSWFTMDELKQTSSASLFQNYSLDRLPSCICFLGVAQLKKILKFLEEVSHYCGLSVVSEKGCTTLKEVSSIYRCMAGEKLIVLNRDASHLLLRRESWARESNAACQDACNKVFFDNDITCADIISWILDSSTWEHLIEEKEKICQSEKIVEMLKKEHNDIHRLCDRRLALLKDEEMLIALESILEPVNQDKMSFLRKRLNELKKRFYDSGVLYDKSEMHATSIVLREAEHLNAYLGSYVDNCGGLTWWPPDLASSTEQICIKHAMCIQKHQVSLELAEVDARILRKVSACDYQSLLLPLVKSFLRARFEGWSKNKSA